MCVKHKTFLSLYIGMIMLLAVFDFLSCKQGLIPDSTIPALVNDTGVNVVLSFDPNGGYWLIAGKPDTEIKKLIGNAGDLVGYAAVPQKDNVVFNGWNVAGGSLPEKFPARSAGYKAMWRSLNKDEAFYTVEHWQENLENTDFTKKDTEKKHGIIGKPIPFEPNKYQRFDFYQANPSIPPHLAADGTTKVVLKYLRKQVTLTFNLDGGKTDTVLTGGNTLTGKYNAPLVVKKPTKDNHIFKGWKKSDGTIAPLPMTFPLSPETYTAQWEKNNGNPLDPPPVVPENLIKNADFSQLKPETGPYKTYWKNSQSPVDWNVWVEGNNAAIPDVIFNVGGGIFSVTAGSTSLPSAIGIHQTLTLPDTTQGTQYTLKVKMKITTSSTPQGAGGGRIRLVHKAVCTKYSGETVCTIPFKIEAGNKISFTDDKNNPVHVDLMGTSKNQVKVELFAPGLKHGTVSFSDISLIKGTSTLPPPSETTAQYTVEHHQENANDNGFTLKETETKSGTVGSAPDAVVKNYQGFEYSDLDSVKPAAIEAGGTTTVKLKYKRKQVTLTFNLDGGATTTLSGGNTLTGKYGAELTVADPVKAGWVFKGWDSVGGTLPATFPLDTASYTAKWEKENLIKNADFSQLKPETGIYKAYWGTVDPKSPASWSTIAKTPTTADVVFKAENNTFSITAKDTPLQMGKLQQPILSDPSSGNSYVFTATMQMSKNQEATAQGGAGIIKFYDKEVLKKTSAGTYNLSCKITVESTTTMKIETTIDGGSPKTDTVSLPVAENKRIIELMGYNLKGYVLSFSNISLTKE